MLDDCYVITLWKWSLGAVNFLSDWELVLWKFSFHLFEGGIAAKDADVVFMEFRNC